MASIRNYIAGICTGSVRMIIHVLTGLWLTPYTLHHLDRERFAIFSLTLDMVTWLALLDLGITAGLRIQASRLAGLPERDKINRLASTAFFAQNIIVLVVFLVGLGIAAAFPYFFSISPALQRDAAFVMAISALGAAVSISSQTFSALLVANQQMHVDNMIGLLLIVIRTVLTVVLLNLGWGIYSLAVAHLAAKVTTSVLAVIRTYKLLPGLQIKYRHASLATFREIGGLGIWFSLGGLAGIVIHSLDSAVAAKVISVETVTIFVLTGRFYELTSGLVWLITENARPMLGQMLGQNKINESLQAYRQLFAISTGLSVVAALAVWAGNASFIERWVGVSNYAGPWVDLALAFTVITALWNMPNRVILSANLAVRGQCLVRLLEGAVNLGLSIWFGKKFGLVGIPAATVLACAITSMWVLPLLTAKMFNRSFWQFLWDDAARVLVLIGLLLPIAFGARSVATDISGYPGAAVGGTITAVCGLLFTWFILVDKSLRAKIPIRATVDRLTLAPLRIISLSLFKLGLKRNSEL